MDIALVDDHPMFRQALALVLKKSVKCTLWNQASNGLEFIYQLEQTEDKPDVALIDLNMPEMDGLELTKWLKENKPEIKTLMISQHYSDDVLELAINCGVSGYITKSSSIDDIKKAINCVVDDDFYFNSTITEEKLNNLKLGKFRKSVEDKVTSFSRREKEVAILICDGLSRQEIADEIGVSKRTVDGYIEKLFNKMGVHKVNGIIMYAAKRGWV